MKCVIIILANLAFLKLLMDKTSPLIFFRPGNPDLFCKSSMRSQTKKLTKKGFFAKSEESHYLDIKWTDRTKKMNTRELLIYLHLFKAQFWLHVALVIRGLFICEFAYLRFKKNVPKFGIHGILALFPSLIRDFRWN